VVQFTTFDSFLCKLFDSFKSRIPVNVEHWAWEEDEEEEALAAAVRARFGAIARASRRGGGSQLLQKKNPPRSAVLRLVSSERDVVSGESRRAC
jgi:hypothetical protein